MEQPRDILLGKFDYLGKFDGSDAVLVRRLDFIVAMVGECRAADIVSQWEASDRHYDYVVCDGGSDTLLFLNEEDMLKYQFYTCLCPVTRDYRLVSEADMEAYGINNI